VRLTVDTCYRSALERGLRFPGRSPAFFSDLREGFEITVSGTDPARSAYRRTALPLVLLVARTGSSVSMENMSGCPKT
jgi:hypothetical protein